MAPRSRRRTGDGFSLVDLQPTLTAAVSSIADELSSQGVEIDTNSLLMGIQQIVNGLVMNNPGALMASDDNAKPPYNIAADMFAMAYSHYHAGDKQEAVRKFLTACDFNDAAALSEALLMMNEGADINKRLSAAEDDSSDNTDDTTDDEDDSDDSSDDEMSDDEIDDLINESADDKSDDEDDSEDDDAPMGGASSAKPTPPVPPKPVTASTAEERTRRILAIKMSSAGDESARKRAARLIG